MPKSDPNEDDTSRRVPSGDEFQGQWRTVSDKEKLELVDDAKDFKKRRERAFLLLSREGEKRGIP
jgi:hypothetical protein